MDQTVTPKRKAKERKQCINHLSTVINETKFQDSSRTEQAIKLLFYIYNKQISH